MTFTNMKRQIRELNIILVLFWLKVALENFPDKFNKFMFVRETGGHND